MLNIANFVFSVPILDIAARHAFSIEIQLSRMRVGVYSFCFREVFDNVKEQVYFHTNQSGGDCQMTSQTIFDDFVVFGFT